MTDWPDPLSTPVLTGLGTQPAMRFLGAVVRILAGGEQTAGAFALLEHQAERGHAAPRHIHDREDETFFVLDGSLRVAVGDEEYAAEPGTVAVLPRRLPHAFVVTSPTARFLTVVTPAGFERFSAEVGTPLRAPPQDPPDVEALRATAARFGIEVIGPPPSP